MSNKPKLPHESPVTPELLSGDSKIKFRCYKGISCFNACCQNIDITLTPYDILRLKQRLDITTDEFLPKYTVPFEMDAEGTPGIKLNPVDNGTACRFLTEEGCSVYEDRPTSCRYYPLGLMSMRKKDSPTDEQAYALVVEEHCKGHDEDRELTVDEYRAEQELEDYDKYSRGWRQLILKKKSAGPAVGKPSKASMQLFFMASYHIDQFQRFCTSEAFLKTYDLEPEFIEQLKTDQAAVIEFGARFLKHTLFDERTIPMKEGAEQAREQHVKKRVEENKKIMQAQAEHAAHEAEGQKDS